MDRAIECDLIVLLTLTVVGFTKSSLYGEALESYLMTARKH